MLEAIIRHLSEDSTHVTAHWVEVKITIVNERCLNYKLNFREVFNGIAKEVIRTGQLLHANFDLDQPATLSGSCLPD